ncbi:hypothetical protein CARUB_v10023449mg [Capsella rubella]|uniref:TIR domain-containing protein n=1 Tax=Capsella rubella TaxID=81985 RepID=R0HTF3_9BRAS|nr:TMV resistance protein N [Capsella rubella]EOA27333.1 hypothetical protein CARUB_v10023449mg [Capsella rubella]
MSDVFLSFRDVDTRRNFISFLYTELIQNKLRIPSFKYDLQISPEVERISPELERAIEGSRFAVVVVSENYSASPWCLAELVKVMDFVRNDSITVIPVFYDVEPCHVRRQIGKVAEHFKMHEAREDHEKVLLWRRALTDLGNYSGICASKCEDDSKIVDKITELISKNLMNDTTRSNGSDLEGTGEHMKAFKRLLNLSSKKGVRLIGISERGSNGRSAIAKVVYESISQHFESHFFMESEKMIYKDLHMSHLFEEWMIQIRLENKKVLLVVDDIKKLEQFDVLADDINSFGPGSVVIITTQDKKLLSSSGIKLVYEVECQRFEDFHGHLRELAFKEKDISAALDLFLYRATNLAMDVCGRSFDLVRGKLRMSNLNMM